MEPPIACALDAADARAQVNEWRALLSEIVTAVEWQSPTSVSMRLHADPGAIASLVDLAGREAACCPFFHFMVGIDAYGITFTASVPPEAAGILEQFAGLAS